MDLDAFRNQLDSLRKIITGLSFNRADEHIIGIHQGLLLDTLQSASGVGLSREEVLTEARSVIQLIVQLAERDNLPLSHELETIIEEYAGLGQPIERSTALPRSHPLAAFPKDPPVKHTVFVDESGSASFEEELQPVLCLTGVLVKDERISDFDAAMVALLQRYGVPSGAEIHAQPCLSGEDPFASVSAELRYELLKEFVHLGLAHALGVHYMSMLKPLIKPKFRARLKELGLNAYTSNVLYFNLTLQAAVVGRAGFVQYRYVFDRTDSYAKDIRRILRALKEDTKRGLHLHAVSGDPTQVDSRHHRFIQLADVIGYFLTRYRQFEVKTYSPRESLRKHESKYREMHAVIQPHVMSFIKEGLYRLVDWKAIQEWSLSEVKTRPKPDKKK